MSARTDFFSDGRDEPLVVGDEDDTTVPSGESVHQSVETLEDDERQSVFSTKRAYLHIEVVSRLHGCVSKRISNGSGQLQTSSSSRT